MYKCLFEALTVARQSHVPLVKYSIKAITFKASQCYLMLSVSSTERVKHSSDHAQVYIDAIVVAYVANRTTCASGNYDILKVDCSGKSPMHIIV